MAKDKPLNQKITPLKAIKSILKIGGYSFCPYLIISTCLNNNLSAQNSVANPTTTSPSPLLLSPLTTEGVAKYVDKKGRNPILTVQQSHRPGVVTLLAHAVAPSKEFEQFPIQLDFFINGAHFTSQISSPSLPRPLGIDVSSERAKLPFNYTVIARIIHPNSVYTSMLEGASFEQAAVADKSLSCSVGYDKFIFESDKVITERISEDSYIFSVPEVSSNSKVTVKFSLPLVSENNNSETRVTTSGTVTLPNELQKAVTGTITVFNQNNSPTSGSSPKYIISDILLRDSSNEVEVACSTSLNTPEVTTPTVTETPDDGNDNEDGDDQDENQNEQEKEDLVIENVLF